MSILMMVLTLLTIAALSPDDSERLEIELRVWFEVLVGQPVEGDVHMRYLVVRAMMMIKVFDPDHLDDADLVEQDGP